MKLIKINALVYSCLIFFQIAFSGAALNAQTDRTAPPIQPTEASEPGSAQYPFSLFHETLTVQGRTVDFYAPAEIKDAVKKVPVIIFGHGQAIPVSSYQESFVHLAKKGYAVIFPMFDTGFFDQDWRRMGSDYVTISAATVKKYNQYVDPEMVIFAGHSKGAYVGLVASGLPNLQNLLRPSALVFFDPAGFDAEYLKNIEKKVPVTLTWAEGDTVIKKSLIEEIYTKLPSDQKQLITVNGYKNTQPNLTPDHFFPLSKKFSFGGVDGITPFHYFGTWKWLIGAAEDVRQGSPLNNVYIYGNETASKGQQGSQHTILKNW